MSILQAYFQTLGIGDPYVLDVQAASLYDTVIIPDSDPFGLYSAACAIYFQTDGTVDYTFENATNTPNQYDWVSPAGFNPGDYSIRVTGESESGTGTTFAYPANWTSLSSGGIISIQKFTGLGTSTLSGTIQLSKDGGSTVADSASFTLQAERIEEV